jgi:hypothetical protein
MTESSDTPRSSTHAGEERARREPRPSGHFSPTAACDLSLSNWRDIAAGIALAGGAYPLVFALLSMCVAVVGVLWRLLTGYGEPSQLVALIGGVFGGAMIVLMAAFVGIFWSSIVTLITLPFVYGFVRSLQLRGGCVWCGAIWGGLVGFVAVLPIALTFIDGAMRAAVPHWPLLLMFAAGPGLTTILGQLGGAWGGLRAARQRWLEVQWAARIAAYGGSRELDQSRDASTECVAPYGTELGLKVASAPAGDDNRSAQVVAGHSESNAPPRFQFNIRHLLWITVWLSLLLTTIRLSGIPFEYVLPLLVLWLCYQSATLYVGTRIVRRWDRWWARPQTQLAGRIL